MHDMQALVTVLLDVMEFLSQNPNVRDWLQYESFYGFEKAPLSSVPGFSLGSNGVQIEIVRVNTDLSHEVHRHNQSNAVVMILGEHDHFPCPQRGFLLSRGRWRQADSRTILRIPAGTQHGFTVEKGGELYFLSVQSPPIVSGGHVDYERVAATHGTAR